MSHSSAESEIISLDVGLRKDGILDLDLWDVVIEVLHSFDKPRKFLKQKRIQGISGKLLAHVSHQVE